jgi:hypothetical protein
MVVVLVFLVFLGFLVFLVWGMYYPKEPWASPPLLHSRFSPGGLGPPFWGEDEVSGESDLRIRTRCTEYRTSQHHRTEEGRTSVPSLSLLEEGPDAMQAPMEEGRKEVTLVLESTEQGRKKIKPKSRVGSMGRHDLGRRRTKKKRGKEQAIDENPGQKQEEEQMETRMRKRRGACEYVGYGVFGFGLGTWI